MKKWIGLLIVLSVFIFSIKPSYARFVDKKEKTLSSVKLSSPTETIAVTPSVSDVDFNQNSTKTATFSLDIVNNSTLTINKLEITSADGEWSKYYRLDFSDTNISDTNPLVPVKKEGSSESTYKRTINGTITNFQIPSKEISINIKLVFTSVGEKSVEKSVTLSVIPKTINYTEGLTITGNQDVNFSKKSSDDLVPSSNGGYDYDPSSNASGEKWQLTNRFSVPLTHISATVSNVTVNDTDYSPPLNASNTTIVKDGAVTNWQDYFDIQLNWDKTELGYQSDKAFLQIIVKRKSKAISYKKIYANIKITAKNANDTTKEFTTSKSVNITPILDSSGNRTVAWPLNEQFDSQNIYFTPVYYGSNQYGMARTVFPMARFYRTNKEVADINSIQPVSISDGVKDPKNYDLQKIDSLGDTYINNRGYLTYYAMIYGMNGGEQYNDFGRTSSHYRVLKYDFTTNKFYDKFSDGIGTRFDEYMNYINPEQFINTAYQVYQDTNHPINDYQWDMNTGCKVFVTRLNVDFPRVYAYNWYGKRSLEYVFPHKTMSQGEIVFDTYYVGE